MSAQLPDIGPPMGVYDLYFEGTDTECKMRFVDTELRWMDFVGNPYYGCHDAAWSQAKLSCGQPHVFTVSQGPELQWMCLPEEV